MPLEHANDRRVASQENRPAAPRPAVSAARPIGQPRWGPFAYRFDVRKPRVAASPRRGVAGDAFFPHGPRIGPGARSSNRCPETRSDSSSTPSGHQARRLHLKRSVSVWGTDTLRRTFLIIAATLCCGISAGWWACQVELPSSPGLSAWRRTASGWERTLDWTGPGKEVGLHPGLFAAFLATSTPWVLILFQSPARKRQ